MSLKSSSLHQSAQPQLRLFLVLANGGQVALTGFGTFKVTERAARTGRNPKTGEALQIAASKVPTFKAGKGLKDAVNG
nr:HU family DNA-binding protein [Acinetobacter sp. NIPH1876]